MWPARFSSPDLELDSEPCLISITGEILVFPLTVGPSELAIPFEPQRGVARQPERRPENVPIPSLVFLPHRGTQTPLVHVRHGFRDRSSSSEDEYRQVQVSRSVFHYLSEGRTDCAVL